MIYRSVNVGPFRSDSELGTVRTPTQECILSPRGAAAMTLNLLVLLGVFELVSTGFGLGVSNSVSSLASSGRLSALRASSSAVLCPMHSAVHSHLVTLWRLVLVV